MNTATIDPPDTCTDSDRECADCGEPCGGGVCAQCASYRDARNEAADQRTAIAAELRKAIERADQAIHVTGGLEPGYRYARAFGQLEQAVKDAIAKLEAA